MTQPGPRAITELVAELTRPHRHAEVYIRDHIGTSVYLAHHASLLDQLEAATTLLGNADDGLRLGYASKPSARVDAIDTLIRIEHEASRWDYRDRPTVAGTVNAVASRLPAMTACSTPNPRDRCCDAHRLEWEIRRWWTWARLTTGWDRPAWRPDATCPHCGERGSLRVRVDEDQRTAMCTGDMCRETWDEATIGRLAIHIKAETECDRPGCDRRARGPYEVEVEHTQASADSVTVQLCSKHLPHHRRAVLTWAQPDPPAVLDGLLA